MTTSKNFGKYSFTIFNYLIETEGLGYTDVFYSPEYLRSNTEYQSLVLFKGHEVVAVLYYHVYDGAAWSIKWGTYGGIIGQAQASLETVLNWIEWWCQELRLRRVYRVELRLPPAIYDEQLVSFNLAYAMNCGFSLVTDISFVWCLRQMSSFKECIGSSNRNKLNKAKRAGMEVVSGNDLSFLMECHDVVKRNREEQSIPLSLSSSAAEILFEQNGRHWTGMCVLLGQEKVAAGLFLKVKEDIFYVFMWGERTKWRSYSPTLLIGEQLFNKCKKDDFRIVDLGTATESGEVNRGLWDYKKHMGCTESVKFTLQKNL